MNMLPKPELKICFCANSPVSVAIFEWNSAGSGGQVDKAEPVGFV